MYKFLKSIFTKKETVKSVESVPALGVIETAESELFTIKFTHNGRDSYSIMVNGKYSKNGSGCFRYGYNRALSQFKFECSLYGAKVI